jgi:serine/threonine-protein kinase
MDRLERLFRAARLHPPDEREAFLDAACADDAELRERVGALLRADGAADEEAFLDAPAADLLPSGEPERDALVGTRIGPYEVLRPLGRGGMGDVYLALREAPFRRYVALKVAREGVQGEEARGRFAFERQVLAALDHPGIARLLDGGVTDGGRPYFAMEYVEGLPITRYADERRLDAPARVRLFQDVCAAVHYAHQNLVLHRDIKPGNILVTPQGHVKLLDFGIAKLLNPTLAPADSPLTDAGVRPMTPEYASPEQVRGGQLTTASDVYGLGVLLYELLTGRLPVSVAGRSHADILEAVSHEDPERPSTRVARDEPAAPPAHDLAAARGATPDRLRRQLRGDLDAICLKALRKEPGQRYGSAEQLAQDLERALERQPVHARRGTRRYRAGRFLRRHRIEAAAAAVVLTALVGGLGAALWQAGAAHRERDRAEGERAKAEEVARFLEGLFAAADPYAPASGRLDTLRVRDFLERGAQRVRTDLEGQPAVQARMLEVVGRVYRSLGLYPDAQRLLEQSLATRRAVLGPDHPDVAESLSSLAVLLLDTGSYERAQQFLEEALGIYGRAGVGDDPAVAVDLNHLGAVLRERGEYDAAERRHLEALAMIRRTSADQDPLIASFLTDLVSTLEQEGDYPAAERYSEEAVAMHRALYGSTHPALATALRDHGLLLQRRGAYPEAEALFRESLRIVESTLGAEHPQVADLLNRLASVRGWQGDLAAADSIHRRSLALKRRIYGDVHVEVAYGLNNLASVVRSAGRLAEAEALNAEAVAVARAAVGPDHATYWILLGNMATTVGEAGDCRRALPMHRDAIAGMRRTIPRDAYRVPIQQRPFGACLIEVGEYAEAERTLMEGLTALRAGRGAPERFVRETARELSRLYAAWGRPEQARHYASLAQGSD